MIVFACALYAEALPVLKHFQPVRSADFPKDTVFVSDDCKVILTQPGPVPAACTLSRVLAAAPPGERDLFVNLGVCACAAEAYGTVCLANRLEEAATGRTFYPDVLFCHPFAERPLVTSPTVRKDLTPADPALYDMEAAALYQAALPYFGTERMLFLKVVSDAGSDEALPQAAQLGELTGKALLAALPFLTTVQEALPKPSGLDAACEALVQRLADTLQASTTMALTLHKLVLYYALAHGDALAMLQEFIDAHHLQRGPEEPPLTRKDGKYYLALLEQRCLQ